MYSKSIGNLTSDDPTMFWILKFVKETGNPSFWIVLAYILAAILLASSFFAPVQTIFPELKTRAVVLGSLIRIITAAKR